MDDAKQDPVGVGHDEVRDAAAPHPPAHVDACTQPTQNAGVFFLYSVISGACRSAAMSTLGSPTSGTPPIAVRWSVQFFSFPSGPST